MNHSSLPNYQPPGLKFFDLLPKMSSNPNVSAPDRAGADFDFDGEGDFMGEQPEVAAMLMHNAITIFLTVLGNLLLIYVILKNNSVLRRKRTSPVQILMLHMCAADLLYAFVTILPTMLITATIPVFHGPNILCKFVKFLQVVPMYTSAFLLVAISADRYGAICRPLARMRSGHSSRPNMYAVVAWCCAILLSTPQLFIFAKTDDECRDTYTAEWQYSVYVIFFNLMVWLLPSSIAGFFYFRVCRTVWTSMAFGTSFKQKTEKMVEKSKLVARTSSSFNNNTRGSQNSYTTTAAACHSEGGRHQRLQFEELDRRRVQTVKLTLTIVAANFLLWAPFCIISVIDALMPRFLSPIFATYIMFFGNLNSCVNPWIWFCFNRQQLQRAFFTSFSPKFPFFMSSRGSGEPLTTKPLNSSDVSENTAKSTTLHATRTLN
ncbi:hypothetical protein L596_010503 [Steinernema carpocapsae]|uniref:G-protein coupled receptors family 1 profile domain-containing protein n=1 Tax=Steinernema carpocapsae TaxID=34508 RepID=A0A4U5PJ25_STECR|nr:hypothetical protein L596_010503 [Steinernema carpocapsae]